MNPRKPTSRTIRRAAMRPGFETGAVAIVALGMAESHLQFLKLCLVNFWGEGDPVEHVQRRIADQEKEVARLRERVTTSIEWVDRDELLARYPEQA
jgi:hypothetical protein